VPRDDRLRHGGHAYQRGAQRAKGTNLRRRLEAWAWRGEIDSLFESKTFFACSFMRQCTQPLAVGLGHVEETEPCPRYKSEARLIGACQRIPAHEVDVVSERDKLAHAIAFGNTACRIG
jgi:hypothetical protein